MKKIVCLSTLIFSALCFGHSFNESAFNQEHEGVRKHLFETGQIQYGLKEDSLFDCGKKIGQVAVSLRIFIENSERKIQIFFYSKNYQVEELFFLFDNQKIKIDCFKRDKIGIVPKEYFRFVGNISLDDYVEYFVKKKPSYVRFTMPEYSNKTFEVEILPDWQKNFDRMKVFFKVDPE